MAKRRIKTANGQRSGGDVKQAGRRQIYLLCAVLILATLIVYWQTARFGFVNCDDDLYVENNHVVHGGLCLDSLSYAFTTSTGGNWMPLVWISYLVDHDAAGTGSAQENPQPYHVTNVMLHIANTLLLFFVLYAMTGCRWRSGFVALLFAIHPLHVESVAWVSERKDTLSTLFWLLTMLAYVWYVRRPNLRRYALVLGAFVLGIMSKPMLVSLPIVLLLIDLWPLRRLADGGKSWRSPILEKTPLLVISGIGCAVAVIMQRRAEAMTSLNEFPLGVRLANAAVSCVIYIRKMFWPSDLSWQYQHPGASIPVWEVAACIVLVIALTAGAVWMARRRPFITVGWFWYLITLLPVVGIVQVGHQAMADRYTYVPLIGLFVIVAWGAAWLWESLMPRPKEHPEPVGGHPELVEGRSARSQGVIGLAAAICLMVCAYIQCGYWHDSVSLAERTVSLEPSNSMAQVNLGLALLQRHPALPGDNDAAIEHLTAALRLDPSLTGAEYGIGAALLNKGQQEEATKHFEQAIKLDPHAGTAQNALGVLLWQKGRRQEALEHLEEAVRCAPENESIRKNRDFVKQRMVMGYGTGQ